MTPATINEISREDFIAYEVVRQSGVCNMYDPLVRELTGISKAVHVGIIQNYSELLAKWQVKR